MYGNEQTLKKFECKNWYEFTQSLFVLEIYIVIQNCFL